MKAIILSLLFFAGSSVFAAQPSSETQRIAKVLLASPQVISQLNAQYTDTLTDIQITSKEAGVTDYVLTFKRSCFCMEQTATVKVNEDLRPTFADGPPIYNSTVTFSK